MARAAPKNAVAELLGVDWETVGRMIERVVSEAMGEHDGMDGLRLLGRRPEDLDDGGRLDLTSLKLTNQDLYAGYLIHDQLRTICQLPDTAQKAGMLAQWICMAAESGFEPFEKLALTIDDHYDAIGAAMQTGLSNGRIEAMISTVRLLSHRGRGFRSLPSLLAMSRARLRSIPLRLPGSGVLTAT